MLDTTDHTLHDRKHVLPTELASSLQCGPDPNNPSAHDSFFGKEKGCRSSCTSLPLSEIVVWTITKASLENEPVQIHNSVDRATEMTGLPIPQIART